MKEEEEELEVEMGMIVEQEGPTRGVVRMHGFVGGRDDEEDGSSSGDDDEEGLIEDSCSYGSDSDDQHGGDDLDDDEEEGGRKGVKGRQLWRQPWCRPIISSANGAAVIVLLFAVAYMLGRMQGTGERYVVGIEKGSGDCPAGAVIVSPGVGVGNNNNRGQDESFRVCLSGGARWQPAGASCPSGDGVVFKFASGTGKDAILCSSNSSSPHPSPPSQPSSQSDPKAFITAEFLAASPIARGQFVRVGQGGRVEPYNLLDNVLARQSGAAAFTAAAVSDGVFAVLAAHARHGAAVSVCVSSSSGGSECGDPLGVPPECDSMRGGHGSLLLLCGATIVYGKALGDSKTARMLPQVGVPFTGGYDAAITGRSSFVLVGGTPLSAVTCSVDNQTAVTCGATASPTATGDIPTAVGTGEGARVRAAAVGRDCVVVVRRNADSRAIEFASVRVSPGGLNTSKTGGISGGATVSRWGGVPGAGEGAAGCDVVPLGPSRAVVAWWGPGGGAQVCVVQGIDEWGTMEWSRVASVGGGRTFKGISLGAGGTPDLFGLAVLAPDGTASAYGGRYEPLGAGASGVVTLTEEESLTLVSVDAVSVISVRVRRLAAILSVGEWLASVPFTVDPQYVTVSGRGLAGRRVPIGVATKDISAGGVAEIALAGAVSVFNGLSPGCRYSVGADGSMECQRGGGKSVGWLPVGVSLSGTAMLLSLASP